MENDKPAQEVIREWQQEESDASNTMNLYQQVANHFFPRENQITTTRTPGEDKSLPIMDPTGMLDLQDMAAGMSAVILPAGQYFFRVVAQEDDLNDREDIRSATNRITQIAHAEILRSNFVEQFNEFLTSLIAFGTGNIFSDWDDENLMLNYRDWDVSDFRFGVDKNGRPNRCLIRWEYTAAQAYELFGENAGKDVVKYATDMKDSRNAHIKKFWFIFRVQKRKNRDVTKEDKLNYKFSETVINETEKVTVKEGGYREFPHHITRWLTTSKERWGHGQGTIALSADKTLQLKNKDQMLSHQLQNAPPMEVLHTFEGTPNISPKAQNRVLELGSIKAVDRPLLGNTADTQLSIQDYREILHRCFYVKVFAPLDNLPGDRRTTVEIIERVKAGYMRLILPTIRLYNECITPLIERTIQLLHRKHRFDSIRIPPELRNFKLEYLGRLALALQEQQADALQRYAQFSLTMEPVVPNFTADNINVDRAGRRMATVFGVNEGDLNTEEERAAIRQKRAQDEQQMKMLAAAQAGGKAIKDTSQKPEEGSPAEQLLAGVGA